MMVEPSTLVMIVAVGFLLCFVLALKGLKSRTNQKLGSYSAQVFMNKSELKVLKLLDKIVPDIFGPDARVFGQVSYGEFIKGNNPSSKGRINQKRADFAIINPQGQVICVIEYQGAGHFGRGPKARANAEHRDRVKRAACAGAGYQLVEIPATFTIPDVRFALEAARSANSTLIAN